MGYARAMRAVSRRLSLVEVHLVAVLSLVAGVSGCREATSCSDPAACDAGSQDASLTPGSVSYGHDGGIEADVSTSAGADLGRASSGAPDASTEAESDSTFLGATRPTVPASSTAENPSGATSPASDRTELTDDGLHPVSDAGSTEVGSFARPNAGTLDGGGDAASPDATTGPDALWPEVFQLFVANCNTGAFCHEAQQLPPQLVGDEQVVRAAASGRAARIAEMVLSDTMPPLSPLGAEDKQLIAAWASAQ